MAQPIQMILMRQLAGYLSVPLFLVGPNGDLLFYNEPAEAILGRRFDETGAMSANEWSSAFTPEDSDGHLILPEHVPLMITITKNGPLTSASLSEVWTVSAGMSKSRQFRLLGSMAASWVVRPYFGKFRIDACYPLRHPRIARCAGSRDEPIWWQYVHRRSLRQRWHSPGSGRWDWHPQIGEADSAGNGASRHSSYTSPHGSHTGPRLLWPALRPECRCPHLGACQQYAPPRGPAFAIPISALIPGAPS